MTAINIVLSTSHCYRRYRNSSYSHVYKWYYYFEHFRDLDFNRRVLQYTWFIFDVSTGKGSSKGTSSLSLQWPPGCRINRKEMSLALE